MGDWNKLIEDYFGERGCKQRFSVQDSIDTRTAAGRLVLNVLVSVAQWEREVIAERTKDALGQKRAAGELIGEVPFGSELAPDGKTLMVNQTEQVVLEQMRQWRAEGLGTKAIASRLTSEGIPTKTGKAVWIHTTVARMLKRSLQPV